MEELLTIRNLRVWFDVRIGFIAGILGKEQKHVRAIDDISFDVRRGEVFCLVGESGCGKTTTGKALIRLNAPTGGSIFFDVPDADWNQYLDHEARLRELEALRARDPAWNDEAAKAAWQQITGLRKRVAQAEATRAAAASQARRERDAKTRAYLDHRERDLLNGTDPMVTRIVSKERHRIELMETLGAWFSPARARKLEKLAKELKEAKYQVLRASAQHLRTGKRQRKVRHLERRVARMEGHKESHNPETLARIQAMRATLDQKAKRIADLELTRVREERGRLSAPPETATSAEAPAPRGDVHEIESKVAAIRATGGPALEALEIRAWMDSLSSRYDLARWGMKGSRTASRMRGLRRRMQIIYQDPYESLNPKLSIYDIVSEPLLANRVATTQAEAQAAVAKSLEDVGLRPAQEYMFRYPHELSGGQRQRVGIATALVVDPDFIVADEPVSMLDASVRTEIIALLLDLKRRRNLTYLFITHDLGLAWIIADRIAVMYLGKIVEMGRAPEIIQNPRHPYTRALISVVPSPNPSVRREKTILRGERPDAVDIPRGCRFHPRCPNAVGICGWDAEEVRAELEKLFRGDREAFPEAGTVSAMTASGPLALTLQTAEPARLESYLRSRVQAVALQRPALGAIRAMTAEGGALRLQLHRPAEPPLQLITGDITVACHLVVPEAGPAGAPGPRALPAAG